MDIELIAHNTEKPKGLSNNCLFQTCEWSEMVRACVEEG